MIASSTRLSPFALFACLVAISAIGCGRPLSVVELAPMTFVHKAAPIDGTIELCLSPKLRMRQWNVEDHPFKIDLGSRAALNVEILAKSAFSDVIVSFDKVCGSASDSPWLAATILAANREWDTMWSRQQSTTITMEFDLFDNDRNIIWSTTTRGELTTAPAGFTKRRTRAAQAFGKALEIALQQAFDELIESEDVRHAFGAPEIDPALEEAPADPPEASSDGGEEA